MAPRPTTGTTLSTLAHHGGHLSGFLHLQAVTAWGDPLVTAEAVLDVTLSAAGRAVTIAGAELHGTHGDAFAAVLGAVLGVARSTIAEEETDASTSNIDVDIASTPPERTTATR